MIVAVDASALVALGLGEPEREAMLACLGRSEAALIAPINILEAAIVLVIREGRFTAERFAAWMGELGLEEAPIGGGAALQAYLAYGKGVHRARLNLGDCFAYALAKSLDAPLLYKGHDFALTDVRSALQPT